MSKTIEEQVIKESLEYCAKGPRRVSSPMSKTGSKQDIDKKWGDRSNLFKKIEEQDTERSLGHGANGKMTIENSSLKKGMTKYAQKWKKLKYTSASQQGGCKQKRNT